MNIRLMLVLCIALTVAKTQCAAVSTTETLVVAKVDDGGSPTPSPLDAINEEPSAPIKLTEMLVRSEVTMRYAHTAVVTHVSNPASRTQEATFDVLLPDTAFISGFIMTLGGKLYKAYIKEKNEAKKIFNDAVSHGTGAAHIAAKARDSNHFTVSVNVEPKSVAIFNLTYEEMLVRRNGVYNHAINLHPGTVVPNLEVVVHIKESQKITTLRVPEVRTGNEVNATDNDAQSSKTVITRNGDKEVTITFTPDLEELTRLNKIYKDKTRDSASHGYNSWSELEDQENRGLLGQFAVQYDLEHSNNREILVNDGYFVHFLAPDSLLTLNKHIVFVLDTSSSMSGSKMEQLKANMTATLSELNPNDYFNIVQLNSDFAIHLLQEADEKTPENNTIYSMQYNKKLVSPDIASPENIAKAKKIISRLRANGITNMYSALYVAIELIQKFANDTKANKINSNDAKEEKASMSDNMERIIKVLTDGDPTMSETEKVRIYTMVTEKNSGENVAKFQFDVLNNDADSNYLRKLSLRNEGFMRHIHEVEDAALQLQDYYRQVSSPLLEHVTFTYPKEQIKKGTLSKSQFRVVNAGSEIVVAGKLANQTSELAPIISAIFVDKDGSRKPYEIRPKVLVRRVKEDLFPLERLWAHLNMKQLLDQRDAAEQPDDELENKALALALKYSFLTSLTSLVVVKPNGTCVVDAEPSDKNVPQQNNSLQQQLYVYGRAPSVTTTTQLSVTTEVPDEKKYHLENYSWALGLLNNSADAIVFSENDTQIILELSKDINVPRSSGPEEACSSTISSESGPATCVYLTRCASARNITVDDYRKSYCRIDSKYAGVCCPKGKIDVSGYSSTSTTRFKSSPGICPV